MNLDQIVILAIVVIVAIPVAIIYLLISNAHLKRRVKALEQLVAKAVANAASKSKAEAQPLSTVAPKPAPWKPAEPEQTKPPKVAAASEPAKAVSTAEVPPQSEPDGPPKAVVFTSEKLQALGQWLTQNWFYAASAVSLALAGVFLVLYGMEQGLLPPSVRVAMAFGFGFSLVAAGEYIRRRFGDSESSSTAYLPSTFSGAGIVTLFGAVLSARLLYGFIGPEIALIAMACVGAMAMILGWFYGPLLTAVGVIGAMIAPFIIGGSSENPSMLLVYFAIVTCVGLAIDTLRRWAWVSVISLISGFSAGTLLMLGSGWPVQIYFAMYCTLLAVLAIAIPVRKVFPDHSGSLLSLSVFGKDKDMAWPEFPTRLAGGAIVAASVLIFTNTSGFRVDMFWASVATLSILTLLLLLWAHKAPALADLTVVPVVALIATVAGGTRVWSIHTDIPAGLDAPKPLMATIIVAIGIVISISAAWRSLRNEPASGLLALGAAITAPALAIAMDIFWQPIEVLGSYAWALHAMIIGAVMVGVAERFARADGPEDRNRMSFAVLSALSCIAFAMIIMFSTAALTTAVAVTIVAAAWLDKKFDLPLMSVYITTGVAFVGYRLVIDPGLHWAANGPFAEMILSYAGAVAAFAVSYWLVRSVNRSASMLLLESAALSALGIFLTMLLYRIIVSLSGVDASDSHWAGGIGATIWIVLGMAQLHRIQIGGRFTILRVALSLVYMALGVLGVLLTLTVFNPLFDFYGDPVLGPILLNTLIPAYVLPAAAFGFGAWKLQLLKRWQKLGFAVAALALGGVWLGLAIRHFWRGADMVLPAMEQPELYSYTVALLVIGAGVFYQSLARPSALLRKVGLVFIGLAVAKVFFVDISGLGGLIRVFSLLFLGLSLAGLAWLNRWAAARTRDADISSEH